jgi:SAM-dependent methyltransferase
MPSGDDTLPSVSFDWRRYPRKVRNMARRLRMGAGRKEVSEAVWRKRGGEAWVEAYWSDVGSPRRDCIIKALRQSFGTPASVLDVGCNAGPNLRRIAMEFPHCRLVGFDINREAIEGASKRFAELGIDAELSVGSYYDVLPRIATDSIDVVLSSYALAYVPATNLPGVLADIVRIARMGVILAEPQAFAGTRPAGVLTVPWYDWRHDYAAALKQVGVAPDRIEVFDLPIAGAVESGVLVADLRTSGANRVIGAST